MKQYKLSKEAENDLIRIHQRGVTEHGEAQLISTILHFLSVLN